MTVETLTLRCASCGASLSIPRGPEHVTCTFCGTALLVRETGGVTFLERDVAAIREDVGDVRSGVGALLDRQASVDDRLDRIEQATRLQAIRVELDALEKAGKTPLVVGAVPAFAALVALAFVLGARAYFGRVARITGEPVDVPALLWIPVVGAMVIAWVFAATRWSGARRYAQLRAELDACTSDPRPSTPRDVE